MGVVARTLLNLQLRHWLILFAGSALAKRFGFCDEALDYLKNLQLDWVCYAGAGYASLRGCYVRLRDKAEKLAALEATPGTDLSTVRSRVKHVGIFQTLRALAHLRDT